MKLSPRQFLHLAAGAAALPTVSRLAFVGAAALAIVNVASTCVFGGITLALLTSVVQAHDETKYPDLKGDWRRTRIPGVAGPPSYDPTKMQGLAQQAPLTPEYQAILEASVADQAAGGHGNDTTYRCLWAGMPRVMNNYEGMEIVVTPDLTYILIAYNGEGRRIYTDGRSWSDDIEPTFNGYSIGTWIDKDGDGMFDELLVETRFLNGPRQLDLLGLPLHKDNQTVVKERIYRDKTRPNILNDEITTIDKAFTRPWTVTKTYTRQSTKAPTWSEAVCAENNAHVMIDNQNYYIGADGLLMPARKGQKPPDLRHFNQRGQ